MVEGRNINFTFGLIYVNPDIAVDKSALKSGSISILLYEVEKERTDNVGKGSSIMHRSFLVIKRQERAALSNAVEDSEN